MRFRVRHVQQTIADHVESELTRLGWVTPPVNFGTDPLTFLEVAPEDTTPVAANTVATTVGEEGEDVHQQMGGGLLAVDYPVYIDVYGASGGITVSIASDVKAILRDAIIAVVDQGSGQPVEELIEFQDVRVVRPAGAGTGAEFKRFWRTVTATANVTFGEDS